MFKTILASLFPVALFLAMQCAGAVCILLGGSLALSLLTANALTCALLWLYFRLKRAQAPSLPRPTAAAVVLGVVAAAAGIFAGDLLSEQMGLTDLMEDQFLVLAKEPLGVLSIALVGPLAEELVFRKGIIDALRWRREGELIPIVASAAVFGLIHFNPAQVPFACLMGLILGLLYVRTGRLWVPLVVHVANNSVALVQMRCLGDAAKTFTLTQWMGGPVVAWPCIAVSAALSLYLLRAFVKRAPRRP